MTTLAQDLGGVVRLLEKATPGELTVTWMENASTRWPVATDPRRKLTVEAYSRRKDADTRAIAAAVNFLRTHSAEIAGALRDADGWQPIESAPRDRPVIVTNGEAVGEARYLESDGGWWWAGYHPTDAADGYVWQPTHWRPLPAPPTQDSAMQQGGGGGE